VEASKLGVASAEEADKSGLQANDPDKNKRLNIEDLTDGFTGKYTRATSRLLI